MIEFVHNFDFGAHMVEKVLSFEGLLFDLFDGINGSCFFVFGLPDNTIGSFSEIGKILEVHLKGLRFPTCLNGWWKEHESIADFVDFHWEFL